MFLMRNSWVYFFNLSISSNDLSVISSEGFDIGSVLLFSSVFLYKLACSLLYKSDPICESLTFNVLFEVSKESKSSLLRQDCRLRVELEEFGRARIELIGSDTALYAVLFETDSL